jgi:hypothetical protein
MLYITMWHLSPARLFSCGHTTPARLTAGPSLLALTLHPDLLVDIPATADPMREYENTR